MDRFNLFKLSRERGRDTQIAERRHFHEVKDMQRILRLQIGRCQDVLKRNTLPWRMVKEQLEVDDPDMLEQLLVTPNEGGFVTIGADGKAMSDDYLYQRWLAGKGPEPFAALARGSLWRLGVEARRSTMGRWLAECRAEAQVEFFEAKREYDKLSNELETLQRESERAVLKSARVIGATTTGAAKNRALLSSARPGVVLVEEAGEVLEAHVLSVLSPSVQQLILIGDDKQLRPKVETHTLTVAAHNGYDLNCSIFERLILSGMAHCTLELQHRMRPEIASIARHMTYPDLRDAQSVHGKLAGVRIHT